MPKTDTNLYADDKVLVVDLDGTLCPIKKPDENYLDLPPEPKLLARLRHYKEDGWWIIINTARGMRSNKGQLDEIGKNVLPGILEWLEKHDIPCDQLLVGKPWAGKRGFYIDDRAIRPREFCSLSEAQIETLLNNDRIA